VDAGTLYVVATPIGNLEDITFRAVRVLRDVAVVAAEDTRRTGQLLRHFGIPTRVISLHAHNEGQKTEELLERLRRGASVAVVSDAGTPAVSDPGAFLVRAARMAGIRVEPVPGPSAVMAAVSAAGLEDAPFTFLGFPPVKAKDRKGWFDALLSASRSMAVVFFEAPHRVIATVRELGNLAIDQVVVFRELTKLHESSYEGSPETVIAAINPVAGEFTVVVPARPASAAAAERPSDAEIAEMFGQITDKRARDAARVVAARTGLSANEVYDIARRLRP
jgi:16S rRNA (cytidine1402-2'-O)-methyltransferase